MKTAKFLVEYLKSPKTVGALAPSSERLAEKMVRDIDFENAKCIVEYGPGTGVFTDKLVERKEKTTVLLLIEHNKEFCRQLEGKYNGIDNIIVIKDSAENIDKYLEVYNISKVDYVVSGLPFACLPENVASRILGKTKSILNKDGLFITFQYTLLKKGFIGDYFEKIDLERELLNVPPAYVLRCQNP